MMGNKYYYYAIEDKIGDKYHAYVFKVHQSCELLNALNKTLVYVNKDGEKEKIVKHFATAAPTRKAAIEWATAWNNTHIDNGDNYFNTRKNACVYDVDFCF